MNYDGSDRAFLIGNNIHFLYRHGISYKFSNDTETLLYEFVDRTLIDI